MIRDGVIMMSFDEASGAGNHHDITILKTLPCQWNGETPSKYEEKHQNTKVAALINKTWEIKNLMGVWVIGVFPAPEAIISGPGNTPLT